MKQACRFTIEIFLFHSLFHMTLVGLIVLQCTLNVVHQYYRHLLLIAERRKEKIQATPCFAITNVTLSGCHMSINDLRLRIRTGTD
jgi:hypothetical protein